MDLIRDAFANSLQTQARTIFTVSETWLKSVVPTSAMEVIRHQKVGVLWHTFPFILKSLGDLILKANVRISKLYGWN